MKTGFIKLSKIICVTIVFLLLVSPLAFAKDLSLLQKIKYKEVYVLESTGRETAALVGRFSDNVEYVWAVDKWIPAPEHIQYCYKNQRTIRAQFKKPYR